MLRKASEVESQESCSHLGVGKTSCAGFFICPPPSLSRHHEGEEHGYEDGDKHGNKNTGRFDGRLHIRLLGKVYIFRGGTGMPEFVEQRNGGSGMEAAQSQDVAGWLTGCDG